MNCDQAFDCMTDSGRRQSPLLEEHLARCGRCRQMQDTLEPALDLFDELVPEPDLSSRTATRTVTQDSVRVAEQAASRLLSAGAQPPVRGRTPVLRYAAAAMIGAALMGLMGTINQGPAPAFEGAAEAMLPGVDESKCPWELKSYDRGVYPTKAALAVACMKCHHHQGTPLDAGAQPISIELLPDLSAAVDAVILKLQTRQAWSMSTVIAVGPGGGRAIATSVQVGVGPNIALREQNVARWS